MGDRDQDAIATPTRSSFDESSELQTLRNLLFEEEHKKYADLTAKLNSLEKRITDKEIRIQDASEVLAPAFNKTLSSDDQLSNILKPVMVSQFHQTARDEPDLMADALFPILGPAIRKMIAAMLKPKSKTNKRRYQVEQLFLIDKQSGLPVTHASAEAIATHDADMVSGMLSAIQSFVHDAFSANEFDGLDTLQVGELSVWIEWGPDAVLAAVIRGVAPQNLRESMQLFLESIHQRFAVELTNYEGDSLPFVSLKPELVHFLDSHDGSLKNAIRGMSYAGMFWAIGAITFLLCIMTWLLIDTINARQWNSYIAQVSEEPGLLVTKTERGFRSYSLSGLKDPMAREPSELVDSSGIKPELVSYQFKPYQSLHPKFVLIRLQNLMNPPDNVNISLNGTILHVTGAVDEKWMAEAERLVKVIPGVSDVVFEFERI